MSLFDIVPKKRTEEVVNKYLASLNKKPTKENQEWVKGMMAMDFAMAQAMGCYESDTESGRLLEYLNEVEETFCKQ